MGQLRIDLYGGCLDEDAKISDPLVFLLPIIFLAQWIGPAQSAGTWGGRAIEDLNDDFEDSTFSGWSVLNPASMTITETAGVLQIAPVANSVWYNAETAGFVYKDVTGNFKVTSYVIPRDLSDPENYPAISYRLGGIMARNADTTNGQNYVFIVLGADDDNLSVETKTNVNSSSTFIGPAWPNGEGEIRICRVDEIFRLYVRSAVGADWLLQNTYTRADLPSILQVGPVAYANQADPDLRIDYSYVNFAPVTSAADCILDEQVFLPIILRE